MVLSLSDNGNQLEWIIMNEWIICQQHAYTDLHSIFQTYFSQ